MMNRTQLTSLRSVMQEIVHTFGKYGTKFTNMELVSVSTIEWRCASSGLYDISVVFELDSPRDFPEIHLTLYESGGLDLNKEAGRVIFMAHQDGSLKCLVHTEAFADMPHFDRIAKRFPERARDEYGRTVTQKQAWLIMRIIAKQFAASSK